MMMTREMVLFPSQRQGPDTTPCTVPLSVRMGGVHGCIVGVWRKGADLNIFAVRPSSFVLESITCIFVRGPSCSDQCLTRSASATEHFTQIITLLCLGPGLDLSLLCKRGFCVLEHSSRAEVCSGFWVDIRLQIGVQSASTSGRG